MKLTIHKINITSTEIKGLFKVALKHSILDTDGVCLLCFVLFLIRSKAPQRNLKFHSGFISSSHIGFTILKLYIEG